MLTGYLIRILFISILNISLLRSLMGQTNQERSFTVNTYQYVDTTITQYNKVMCESFEVNIKKDKINIGDDYDLDIIETELHPTRKGMIRYRVKDYPKNEDYSICFVVVAYDEQGDSFIQVGSCDKNGDMRENSGILFYYTEIIPWYDVWRFGRNHKIE